MCAITLLQSKPLQVRPYDLITLAIYSEGGINDELLFWIAEPGEEFYLHHSLWREVPFAFKMTALTETIDITLKRVVKKQVGDCESSEEYDYTGKAILQNNSLSLKENLSL